MSDEDIKAELDALPDSSFFVGLEHVVSRSATFRAGRRVLTFVGWQDRRVWDDASDEWVWRRSAGCRPATRGEAIAAGIEGRADDILAPDAPVAVLAGKPRRYAVRADSGKGYFAIAGKKQSGAATMRAEKATTWATREEATAALDVIAEDAPGFFGANQGPVVVEIK